MLTSENAVSESSMTQKVKVEIEGIRSKKGVVHSKVAYGDRSINPLNITFFNKDFYGFETERFDFRFFQWFASLQLLYLPV